MMLCASGALAQNGTLEKVPERNPPQYEVDRANSASAITVNASTGMTPEELVSNIFLGNGVNISNVKFNGVSTALTTNNGLQIGTFTADTTGYTFPTHFFGSGLIMTTGNITASLGPNDSNGKSVSISYTPPACTELSGLVSNYTVYKPAVLEFDFMTVADHISFNYIFASEEYPEYVGSNYNDVFGFFVTDMQTNVTQNIALVPNTTTPVAINNVSVNSFPQYYSAIASSSPLMQYDAYVGPFVAEMDVVPCRNYHMKLAIANVGDNAYDSGVFLEAASFSAPVLNEAITYQYEEQQSIITGCYNADITFTLPLPVQQDTSIVLQYSGTAINGVDITDINGQPLPEAITMPAGDSTYTIGVYSIDDGQYHGDTLTLTIQYESNVCTMSQIGTINISIVRDAGLSLSSSDINTCSGINSMSVNLDYGTATNIQWSPATNLTNPHSLTTGFINPPQPGTTQYTVTATDKYGCKTASTTFNVTVAEAQTQNVTDHICQGLHYTNYGFDISADEPGLITQSTNVPIPGTNCYNVLNLNLTVDPAPEETIEVTRCDSYTWEDGTQIEYTESGIYDHLTQTANGCDNIVHLDLTINNSETHEFSETKCDTYTWDNTEYTSSGDYTKSYQTVHGCDSIVTLHLTINNSETHEFSETRCDTYTWDNTEYTSSGDYTKSYQTVHGCDSIVTLHLSINNSETHEFSETRCDTYTWDNTEYTTSGDYTKSYQTTLDCDSIVTLHLTINNSETHEFTETSCDAYTWDNTEYTSSGDYTKSYQTVHDCDSTVTLHLTINYSDHNGNVTETACDSYLWNGQTYTESGTYTYPTQTVHGCDSTATLHLTVNYSDQSTSSAEVCDSYLWNGQTYTESGVYTFPTLTALGCDSTATLNLTIHYSEYPEETQDACETFTWHDIEYTTSGDYTFDDTTAYGCTHIETLHLTINHSEYPIFNETACDEYEWHGQTYTQGGEYTYTTTTQHGCERIETLHLSVNHSSSSTNEATECDSYMWNGQTYTLSGTYQYTTHNSVGCDSTAYLNLTINNSEYPIETIKYCDSYLWNGQEYTNSGTYTYETLTQAGCERIETLNLLIVETPDIVVEGAHNPIGGSETSFSVYNYEIVPQNSATVFDSIVWSMGNENWYIDPHNNGMDVDLHIFTWIPDTVQLIATVYNECGSFTYPFWIHTSYYGIEDNDASMISITPNPNNGIMDINLNNLSGNTEVKVFDIKGNQIDSFVIDDLTKIYRYEMPQNAAGVYNFVITNGSATVVKRVAINR